VFNIKNDDKLKASHSEENTASLSNSEVSEKDAIHDFDEEQLVQNLKNYIDCNVEGMDN
jgi:hypothetical protein